MFMFKSKLINVVDKYKIKKHKIKVMDCFTLYVWIISLFLIITHKCGGEAWNNKGLVSYYADDSQEFTREAAEAACEDRGGRLAMLKDAKTHQFVFNILPTKRVNGGTTTYHIALNRGSLQCGCGSGVSASDCTTCRRSWRWEDGAEMTVERWQEGMPFNEAGRDCGVENSWQQYAVGDCGNNRGFICQNQCAPSYCHRSDCSLDSGVYICQCDRWYTGQHCDTEIDDCAPRPCLNGATCLDQVDGFQCNCVSGYTGGTCATDINECEPEPCLNGATCGDRVNHYSCACQPGFTGADCKTEINECESDPCLNGGGCIDLIGSYNCSCVENYSGVDCEIDIDECESQPCLHGASCNNMINDFSCDCIAGYTGERCETDLCDKHVDQNNSPTLKGAVVGLSVALVVVSLTVVVLLFVIWRRSRNNVETPAKVAFHSTKQVTQDTPVPSLSEKHHSEDPEAIYEPVQIETDEYQNAYQVLA